jgi:hypothetical protein
MPDEPPEEEELDRQADALGARFAKGGPRAEVRRAWRGVLARRDPALARAFRDRFARAYAAGGGPPAKLARLLEWIGRHAPGGRDRA